jgi:hypothetical protein
MEKEGWRENRETHTGEGRENERTEGKRAWEYSDSM